TQEVVFEFSNAPFYSMEQKIIDWCLSADECEEFLRVLEIRLQCREMERQLAIKKHMAFLLHAQLCRKMARVGFSQRLFSQCFQTKCTVRHCAPIRQVLAHALRCRADDCSIKYCRTARNLAAHYDSCKDAGCPICSYARKANGDRHGILRTKRV